MELRDGQNLVFVTPRDTIRGRLHLPDPHPAGSGIELKRPGLPGDGGQYLELLEATILDSEGRILRKASRLTLNLQQVIYLLEDDRAPILERVKALIDREDLESALAELAPLIRSGGADGDLFYLAGVVYQGLGSLKEARQAFQRALELTLDPRVREIIARHIEAP